MKQATLKYTYTNAANEKMVFLCRVTLIPRTPMRLITQDVKSRLEKEVGAISDLRLVAQNDPLDVAMLDAQGS